MTSLAFTMLAEAATFVTPAPAHAVEILLLAMGGVCTLVVIGFFIFVFTRKDKNEQPRS